MKNKSGKSYQNEFILAMVGALVILCQLVIVNPALADAKHMRTRNTDVREVIVKVYTVASEHDYYSPWKIKSPSSFTGSGCVIAKNRILTNAHVVSNQKFIEVQLYGQAKRYNAHVLYVSHEADLALLTVEDTSFFSDIEPLEFGALPETLQEVLVYGFPTGGESLSITKGILSRVEYQEYTHSGYMFLAGQIDAAINPGNSGGPVIVDNKIVGIAMQKISSSGVENIGYLIPTPIIKHFLDDIEDGRYDGFPDLGFTGQPMGNQSMKEKYGMTEDQTGVLVVHVYWNSSAQSKVKKDDVLMEIDGHEIADDGSIEFRPKERIHCTYYGHLHQVGDSVNLTVLRNGRIVHITYPLNQTGKDFSLVSNMQYDINPRYIIFGGIVFSPLTKNLLCAWTDCNAPDSLKFIGKERPTEKRQEVVVAVQVLSDDINKGYHDIDTLIIKEVNGRPFKDFNEFIQLVIESKEPFVVFNDNEDHQIVIDREKAEERHERILHAYYINDDKSPDMRRVDRENYLTSKQFEIH